MQDAPDQTSVTWRVVGTHWQAPDVILAGANGIFGLLSVLAARSRPDRAAGFLLLHGLLAVAIIAAARTDWSRMKRATLLRAVHDWAPALIMVGFYFELSAAIPRVHPYDTFRYDHAFQAIDVWLLGDDPAHAITQFGARWLSDVLTVCYMAYYPLIIVVPVALYVRREFTAFRTVSSIVMVAFTLSYVGYALCPALGPHVLFDGERASVLNGYGLAAHVYAMLRDVPSEPPDAFPSGHALMGLLAPAMAWRFRRSLFPWILPVGTGIVLATIYLRFHYLIDVFASFVLAPIVWTLGRVLDERMSRRARSAMELELEP
jgi:membrane-associated phospholipid phosphatase